MSVQRHLKDAIRLKQLRVLWELYRKTEHAVWLLQTPKKFWVMLATKRRMKEAWSHYASQHQPGGWTGRDAPRSKRFHSCFDVWILKLPNCRRTARGPPTAAQAQ